jgi:hypothetical protein
MQGGFCLMKSSYYLISFIFFISMHGSEGKEERKNAPTQTPPPSPPPFALDNLRVIVSCWHHEEAATLNEHTFPASITVGDLKKKCGIPSLGKKYLDPHTLRVVQGFGVNSQKLESPLANDVLLRTLLKQEENIIFISITNIPHIPPESSRP